MFADKNTTTPPTAPIAVPQSADQQHGEPGSVRATVAERFRKARAAQEKVLRVPDYDPPLYIVCRPLSLAEASSARQPDPDRVGASHDEAAELVLIRMAGCIARATMAIVELDPTDDEPDPAKRRRLSIDPSGKPCRFGPRLGELLELDHEVDSAAAAVRALYLKDGHVVETFDLLEEWSGFGARDLVQELAGN